MAPLWLTRAVCGQGDLVVACNDGACAVFKRAGEELVEGGVVAGVGLGGFLPVDFVGAGELFDDELGGCAPLLVGNPACQTGEGVLGGEVMQGEFDALAGGGFGVEFMRHGLSLG